MNQELKKALKGIVASCQTAINAINVAEQQAKPNPGIVGNRYRLPGQPTKFGVIAACSLASRHVKGRQAVMWVDVQHPWGARTCTVSYDDVRECAFDDDKWGDAITEVKNATNYSSS